MSRLKNKEKRHKPKFDTFRGLDFSFNNYSRLPTHSLNNRLIFHLIPYYNRYIDFTNDLDSIKNHLIPSLEKINLYHDLEKHLPSWEAQNPRLICEKILEIVHIYQ